MTFTLDILLIPYYAAVGGFALFAALNVYHLIVYGATTRTSFLFTFAFLAGSVLIAYASWWVLRDMDWSAQIVLQTMQSASIDRF